LKRPKNQVRLFQSLFCVVGFLRDISATGRKPQAQVITYVGKILKPRSQSIMGATETLLQAGTGFMLAFSQDASACVSSTHVSGTAGAAGQAPNAGGSGCRCQDNG
jgi:hypothetical protein